MKNFYKKLVMFSIMVFFVIAIIIYLSTTETLRMPIAEMTLSDEFITTNNGPDEIGAYIDKVRTNNKYTKLIIGDSVCHQMYSRLEQYNEDICIAGSNAAVTMVGQYVLLHEFLENHPDATDVWLIIIPSSMTGYFDTYYGYEYIAMPIVEKNVLDILDSDTIDQLKGVYGSAFLNPHIVRLIDRSAPMRKLYLNLLLKHGEYYGFSPVSPISVQYINKMVDLCNKMDVRFHLLPGPVNEETKEKVNKVLEEFNEKGLEKQFPNYIPAITYYPNDQFKDPVHFNDEYSNQTNCNRMIKALGDESLLNYLKLE